jgi:sirohydrochlorin ferrochelatase
VSAPALLAVAHGTRSAAGQAQIRALVDRVACRLPGVDVRLAYVDVQQPRVEDAIPRAGTIIVPLLLSTGYHVRVDIARAAARAGAVVTPPLGPDPVLTDTLRRHTLNADEIILAAAGSSDPGWRAQVDQVAARLGATVAYTSGEERRVADVITGKKRVTIAAYLLADGLFYRSLHRLGADRVTPPLCEAANVHDLVIARYRALTSITAGL